MATPGTRRIGNVTAFFMLGIAFLLDVLQFFLTFVPLLGQVLAMFIAFIAICIFGIWFLLLGINYFSGKKAGLKAGSALLSVVIEIIPVLDALPGITVGVVGIILASRAEDQPTGKLHSKKRALVSRVVRRTILKRG